ncbi:sigma-70 family RNA polymerase sigma factor [Pseudonocardia sp. S2-4]|uniref:RNA polymerase sigma factor n=1 Tax=Pseudonocardia humida TaxID=2800819 RepID=A0ABT0ZRV1_9PSEU|nr:sigma-70 family RNA polymerase sigma factor [Pseudonocardia humida]
MEIPGPHDPDPEPTEAGLLARVRGGERDAFAALVRRHAAGARRTAVLLGAGEEADDVVQEAFVKAYRALGGFREGADFRPWLLRIVANETRNAQRARRRRTAREGSPTAQPDGLLPGAGSAADPAERAVAADRMAALWQRLHALPEPQRRVLVCRFLLDLDEAQTATVLGVARGTVKSRTARGLGRLRALLAEAAPRSGPAATEGAGHG